MSDDEDDGPVSPPGVSITTAKQAGHAANALRVALLRKWPATIDRLHALGLCLAHDLAHSSPSVVKEVLENLRVHTAYFLRERAAGKTEDA